MRILVAYCTRAGSTRGIAEAIAKTLRELGDEVTVRTVRSAEDVSGFDAVIAGSPVRARRWLKEGYAFLDEHRESLARIPVACFGVCLAIVKASESVKEVARYRDLPSERVPRIAPIDSAVFAGALDEDALTPGERLFVRAFRVPPGDYRDWEAIAAWARRMHEAFERELSAVAAR